MYQCSLYICFDIKSFTIIFDNERIRKKKISRLKIIENKLKQKSQNIRFLMTAKTKEKMKSITFGPDKKMYRAMCFPSWPLKAPFLEKLQVEKSFERPQKWKGSYEILILIFCWTFHFLLFFTHWKIRNEKFSLFLMKNFLIFFLYQFRL